MGESFDHCPPGWIRQSRKRCAQSIHNHMVVDYLAMSSVDFGRWPIFALHHSDGGCPILAFFARVGCGAAGATFVRFYTTRCGRRRRARPSQSARRRLLQLEGRATRPERVGHERKSERFLEACLRITSGLPTKREQPKCTAGNNSRPSLVVRQISSMLILNAGPSQPSLGQRRSKIGKEQTAGFEPFVRRRTD